MRRLTYLKSAALGGASVLVLVTGALADEFAIPGGDLAIALDSYTRQTGVALLISGDALHGARTNGARGTLTASEALTRLLKGTGFTIQHDQSGAVAIVPVEAHHAEIHTQSLAETTPQRATASVETVVVTSSKIKGDIQTVPIAITALSQEQLTSRQIAGGPDLVKEVPNLTFSKTNFTGYNIEIRGIGTQAISVTTDPAVAVAFNDTPFIRNHFFEQEFYDVAQIEVLRGPQGTLYGRNATAGVVNVVSAKPTDQFEAMLSADWGNYHNRRYEGVVNLPIVGDKLALRIAGEWTKRDGYSFNRLTNAPIDGRDLWSSRVSLRWRPSASATVDFVWEHFSEDDDRLRSGKQLCKRGSYPKTIKGVSTDVGAGSGIGEAYLGQGCDPVSLYSPDAFGVPDANMLGFYGGLRGNGFGLALDSPISPNPSGYDPYASVTQSRNLRVIESTLNPHYKAKNDTLELNAEWNVTPSLTAYSDTGYNRDFLWSTEDFNRFDTSPGVFAAVGSFGPYPEIIPNGNYVCLVRDNIGNAHFGSYNVGAPCPGPSYNSIPTGVFCDPQLGCSDRLVAEDLSEEHARQFSQEFRVASNFKGPFNFSLGGNYLHYETEENYYVFINTLTLFMADNSPFAANNWPNNNQACSNFQYPPLNDTGLGYCMGYIDINPIGQLDNKGHNYFLSQNPYVLNSYAGFGEANYNVTSDLKLTAGLRWTDDKKHFIDIPSEILLSNYGYPSVGSVDQEWQKWTGRLVANWSPKLPFTDQSMFYASFARGYKAGGANPPGAQFISSFGGGQKGSSVIASPTHPLTFRPEFINAYELGTKNTALDGALTLNGDVFFYDYKDYQISEIVDRTAINQNYSATVRGAEFEAMWQPLPGLKLNFAGGYEDTRIKSGQQAVDLMDRTAGHAGWYLVKPFVTQASNCVLPAYVLYYQLNPAFGANSYAMSSNCSAAYDGYLDPVTREPYQYDLTGKTSAHGEPIDPSYHGFDPLAGTPGDPYTGQNTYNGIDYGPAPNGGEGFAKPLGGNQLPNAPHFTLSLSGDYTMPVSASWAATLHGDFYWQSQSFARVFNDRPYDKIRGYSNVNAALILTDASGWQVMGYIKNVFDTTAITGAFLNSDDTALTTNIFLTDPRLYGLRVTKNFDAGGSGGFDLFSAEDGKPPQFWLTVGGDFAKLEDGTQHYNPDFIAMTPSGMSPLTRLEKNPNAGFDWQAGFSYQPADSDWVLKAGIRYGRSAAGKKVHQSQAPGDMVKYFTQAVCSFALGASYPCHHTFPASQSTLNPAVSDGGASSSERHTILDFTVGKDVGIGLFGSEGTGTIGAGARMAQFDTRARADLKLQPVVVTGVWGFGPNANGSIVWDLFDGISHERRSFHGIGPEVTWDAEQPIWGDAESGKVTFDWGINAAVLFGRQRVDLKHKTSDIHHFRSLGPQITSYITSTPLITRSRSVTVPNLGGYIGASVRYQNAKISLGYRADEFFNAMDGGEATADKKNRGFYGPYLNLSIGIGG